VIIDIRLTAVLFVAASPAVTDSVTPEQLVVASSVRVVTFDLISYRTFRLRHVSTAL